jgi:hypothetical protein
MVPWLRALSLFNDETPGIDGMIAMKVHPIRKTAAVFPDEEIAWYLHSFYVRSDSPLLANWQYEGIESLVGIRVGCVKGWNYCDKTINRYLHAGEAPAVQPLYGGMVQERNFRKLIAGTDRSVGGQPEQYGVYAVPQAQEGGQGCPSDRTALRFACYQCRQGLPGIPQK